MTTETKEVKEKYDVTIQRRASELCETLGLEKEGARFLIEEIAVYIISECETFGWLR